jgi:hypothetical protein
MATLSKSISGTVFLGTTKMVIFLSLILLTESFVLDELYVKNLSSATSNGSAVLFVSISGFNIKTYLFDMKKETGKILTSEKTRIMFPGLNASADGFILDETMGDPKLVHIDLNGEYIKRQYLREFQGWRDDLVVKVIHGDGIQLIANLENHERNTVVVAKIDTQQESITQIHSARQDKDLAVRFYPWEDGYLLLNHRNGLLQKLSVNFDNPQTIRPAGEPLLVDPARPIARRMKYLSMVWPKSRTKSHLVFAFHKRDPFEKAKYPEPIRLALILEGEKLTESTAFILGEYNGKQLLYHFKDQEFELKK